MLYPFSGARTVKKRIVNQYSSAAIASKEEGALYLNSHAVTRNETHTGGPNLKFFSVYLCACCGFLIFFWPPQKSQTIDFNGLFSFRLPAGFEKRPTAAAEEERAEYYKRNTKLVVVWGHTESMAFNQRRQTDMNDYHESLTRLRGQRANIRTYWQTINGKRQYRAELNIGNWENGEVQLYMRLESDDPAMLQIADQIFKSITFPMPSPERPSSPVRDKPAAHIIPSRATSAGIS